MNRDESGYPSAAVTCQAAATPTTCDSRPSAGSARTPSSRTSTVRLAVIVEVSNKSSSVGYVFTNPNQPSSPDADPPAIQCVHQNACARRVCRRPHPTLQRAAAGDATGCRGPRRPPRLQRARHGARACDAGRAASRKGSPPVLCGRCGSSGVRRARTPPQAPRRLRSPWPRTSGGKGFGWGAGLLTQEGQGGGGAIGPRGRTIFSRVPLYLQMMS
jgi:hypothetical protein